MESDRKYTFKIGAFTPATIPMGRLAEYMIDLAKVLGHHESVHFVEVQTGSTKLAYQIDAPAVTSVSERVAHVRAGIAPIEAMQAVRRINERLVEDKTEANVREELGAEILIFPGINRHLSEDAEILTPLHLNSIDGVVQKVAKIREPDKASVTIESADGSMHTCKTYRSTARSLAQNIFGSEVRLSGYCKWKRNTIGQWSIKEFFIRNFEVLNDQKLSEVVSELRSIEGSQWPDIADPWKELRGIRHDGAEF